MPEIIFSARIDKQLHRHVKEYCKKNNIKIQGFLANALKEKLAQTAKVSK